MNSFAVGWRQVAISFLLLAATGMIASTYSVIAVPFAEEFHPSRMVLMLAMTVLSGASAVLAPLLGNLMDRASLRAMMLLGGTALGVGYAALSLAQTFNQVLVIFGLLVAPANVLIGPVAVTVLLSRWFTNRRGTAIGIAIAGIAAGGFVFPIIIQALLDANQWRDALRLLGLILFLCTVPAAALVVNSPAERGLHPDGAALDPKAMRQTDEPPHISVGAVLGDPTFWLAALIFGVVLSGMKGMVTNLAPLAIDEGVKADKAALLISVYAGCGFIAKLGFAALADRLGPRPLMFVSLAGFATGMACLTQASAGYAVIALGVGLIGLFGGLMVPLQSFLIPRIFGQRVVGRAMGLISMVTLCALLSTPPIFGLIFDLTGNYNGIFVAFTALAVATLAVVPYIRLHRREARVEGVAVPAE